MKSVRFGLLLCLALLNSPGTAAETDRPNVLLLLVDDLKPALGCYGDTAAKTPHIDSLAARGMRFDLAYCNQAVCAPSRFTLMLGSHSTSTGLYGLGNRLRDSHPDAVTMPQYFARHGYRTESLGKVFHIGHGNEGDSESFMVPHFKEKVIEYADPKSTPGGKLTREEAFFENRQLDRVSTLPRGAAFEGPEVEDEAYADGRVAAIDGARRALRSSSRRDSPGRISRSQRRGSIGTCTIRRNFRCRSTRTIRWIRPPWRTSEAAKFGIIFRFQTRGIPRAFRRICAVS
jgi:iduronate 2-sulfatase